MRAAPVALRSTARRGPGVIFLLFRRLHAEQPARCPEQQHSIGVSDPGPITDRDLSDKDADGRADAKSGSLPISLSRVHRARA